MAVAESVELKFRLYDGTDIGPNRYAPATTVASLKERLLAQWPAGNENAPRTINDMKLINAGKILENNKTLADSRKGLQILTTRADVDAQFYRASSKLLFLIQDVYIA